MNSAVYTYSRIDEDETNISLNDSSGGTHLNEDERNLINKLEPDKRFVKFHGFFYGILSAMFLALSNVFIKKTIILNGSEQVIVRYTVQLLIMVAIIMFTRSGFLGPVESRRLLMLRGFLGVLTLVSAHFTVKLINPTDAVSIFSLKTIFVAIIARILLNEKINLAHLVCLIFSIIGVFLITQQSLIFTSTHQPIDSALNCTTSLHLVDEYSISGRRHDFNCSIDLNKASIAHNSFMTTIGIGLGNVFYAYMMIK